MTNPQPPAEQPTTTIERAGRPPLTEVHAAFVAGAYFFITLFSYYLLRPVREAMGVQGGWEKVPMLITITLGAMIVVNPVYSAVVSRFPRRVFIPAVYRFFMLNLVVFAILFFLHDRLGNGLGYVFYVWLSVFNLFVVTVFWGLMSDVFSVERSKRLFGPIGIGGTLGAIAGSSVQTVLGNGFKFNEETYIITPWALMLAACVGLELAVQCVRVLVRWSDSQEAEKKSASSREPTPDIMAGIAMLSRSQYLLLIALYILAYSIASTLIYVEQARIVEQTASDTAARTSAFAQIDLWTNVATLVTQALITRQAMRRLGVGGTLTVVPVLTVIGFAALWVRPDLAVLSIFQAVRRAAHFGLDRPARETLFTVVSPDERYKSKSLIDTFIYRLGDLIGAWLPKAMKGLNLELFWLAAPLGAMGVVAAVVLGKLQKAKASVGKSS